MALPVVVGVRSSHMMSAQASRREYYCKIHPGEGVVGFSGTEGVVLRDFERYIALASRKDMDYSMKQEVVGAGVSIARGVRWE